jgi:peptidoglycan lytic transglycosylase D
MILFARLNYLVAFFLIIFGISLFSGCSSQRVKVQIVKDNKRDTWSMFNSRIDRYYWKYRSTKHVKVSLQRAQKFLPYIHQVFRYYQLPPELAYLPILESSFKTDAVSRTGAKGLWQFNAKTAQHVGLKMLWYKDDRLDWKKSTIAAAEYLDELGKRFNYNWELALAAYNGGPTYLAKQIKRQGSWNFWDLSIRTETSQYVPKFLATLRVARERYPGLYFQGAPNFWISAR